jgi:TctA family transporter
MSSGDFSIFATRPISLVLLAIAAAILASSALRLAPTPLRDADSS